MRNLNTILTLGFATTAVTTTLQDKGESPGRHADGFCYTAHLGVFFALMMSQIEKQFPKKIKNEVPPSVLANQIPVRDGVIKDLHPC